MGILLSLSMVFWQTDTSGVSASNDQHLLMIFTAIGALSLLVLAIVTLVGGVVVGLGALKVLKEVKEIVGDVHSKTMPVLHKADVLIDELTPKIRIVSDNAVHITTTVREKVDEVGVTVSQMNRTAAGANEKTRGQVDHVDRMVSSVLTTTEDVTNTVVHSIRVPIKQAAGLVTGIRVALETLIKNFSGKDTRQGRGGWTP
ncbi:MAG: hypothetical protein M3R43_08795 [Acidobacteriota bacterium]|nr:hypothetical protein [Acidobacteriota bacterium]